MVIHRLNTIKKSPIEHLSLLPISIYTSISISISIAIAIAIAIVIAIQFEISKSVETIINFLHSHLT